MVDCRSIVFIGLSCLVACGLRAAGDEVVSAHFAEPAADRWMYPHNATPGTRTAASTYTALPMPASESGVDDRFAQFILRYDTGALGVPAGLGVENYQPERVVLTAVIAANTGFVYDPTPDPLSSVGPNATADPDAGRPIELHGTGFRGGFDANTFLENSVFGGYGIGGRNAFALGYDASGIARDVSHNVTQGFDSVPWAVGRVYRQASSGAPYVELAPGATIMMYDHVVFELDLTSPGVSDYVRQSLHIGKLWLTISSLHSAMEMGTTGYPSFFTKEHPEQALFHDVAATLDIEYSLPLRLAIQRDAATQNVNLQWNAAPGFRYTVQRSETLQASSWTPVAVMDSTGAVPLQWQGVSSSAQAFFRVLRIPLSSPP